MRLARWRSRFLANRYATRAADERARKAHRRSRPEPTHPRRTRWHSIRALRNPPGVLCS